MKAAGLRPETGPQTPGDGYKQSGVSLSGWEVEDAQAANRALSCWLPFSFLLISRLWLPPTPGTQRHCQRIWTGSRQHPGLPCATRCTHVWLTHDNGRSCGLRPRDLAGLQPGTIARYPGMNCARSTIPSVTSARFSLPSLSLPNL